jgi:hypothetical protein
VQRLEQSYEDEKQLMALLPEILVAHGFTEVRSAGHGQMKLIEAKAIDGNWVKFWVKQAWSSEHRLSAIQVVEVQGEGARAPDAAFVERVERRVASAKANGAQYLLLAHLFDRVVRSNYVALKIDDVPLAYRQQLISWPRRARNGHLATMWFDAEPGVPSAECVNVIKAFAVPLSAISGLEPKASDPAKDSKKVWCEQERRTKQQIFRERVGQLCGWTCAISGNKVEPALDAAHLPGKDWRFDNQATDGIMLRADLHRLLDRGLAQLRDGCFWLDETLRPTEYGQFHNWPYAPSLAVRERSGVRGHGA